ncbi:MAG: hypothetical protein HYT13_02515 [Candidatus Liptonbacteria bacterium]|nr:hypothetical protein [Candidatus Liptonbacteria bacterium]
MSPYDYFGKILGVKAQELERLETGMADLTSRRNVFQELKEENEEKIKTTLKGLKVKKPALEETQGGLREAIFRHEGELLGVLHTMPGPNDFERAVALAPQIAKVGKGFFLKKFYATQILEKRPPQNLLKFLGYRTVAELLKNHDVTEAFSALRFIESDEWMHETFEEAYSRFTADDFEERAIELRVLGPEWHEVALQFVAKKHHNVSQLKEFGVIFLNPVKEDMPGKFLRDFALLLHYLYEVEFYAKLFQKYSQDKDFAEKFKAFLRGDVLDRESLKKGEWLIVQRYLFKKNPADPRLYLPRVNPESLHWGRAERALTAFKPKGVPLGLKMWHDLDWVAGVFGNDKEEIVSFDLEDHAMSAVSFKEGKTQFFKYHQMEALWTKIFSEYAGGEEKVEELLLKNFSKGLIVFT